jgi:hypothetical protein
VRPFRRQVSVLVLLGLVGALAACGDDPLREPASIGSPGPANGRDRPPPELVASCGGVRFSELPADPSQFPPLDERQDQIDLSRIAPEAASFEAHEWFVAEKTDDRLVLFGRPLAPGPNDAPYASASFERAGDHWAYTGWGQCRIEVGASGWGSAHSVLHPDVEPDPTSTTVSVLGYERACAGGEPPGDREVRHVLIAVDSTVSLLLLVESPSGAQTCPSNPDFAYEFELEAPLGARGVLDANVDPPLERPWPPTRASLDSLGWEE